ncbi:uncharacterized protein LOC133833143 [Humulus lupulus]|uniref:uncharacterized protein LOC133833143 n=1 Tax=Humulus lupulus TaxID=3486 RepID=UPI002B4040F2|nr:uncharacterized protein LOC133833143 [Humulus lupulus]
MARRRKPGLKFAKHVISLELPSTNDEESEQKRPEEPVIEEPEGLGLTEEQEYDVRSLDEGSKKGYDLDMNHETTTWAAEVEEQSFQDSAKETWAKFRESIPSHGVFEGFVKRIWGNLGIVSVARMNARFTMVKFRDEATRDLVLESGVVHFDRKLVVLRPWTTDIESLKSIKSVPIWIRLPDLGLQYWGVNCLSALVITIGKPIMIDKITQNRSMIKFARVLVEMEIANTLPKFISYFNDKGQIVEQIIDYEWLPTKCSNCKKLGHSVSSCKFVSEAVWRKKEVKQMEGNDGSFSTEQEVVERADCQNGNTSESKINVSPSEAGLVHQTSSSQLADVQVSPNPVEASWISPKKTRVKRHGVQNSIKQAINQFSVLQEGQKPAIKVPIKSNTHGLHQHNELEC